MKTFLDIESWPRKEHFHFFRKFEEPFFGATVKIDCTKAYEIAKANGISFFAYYLHKTLVAVNKIESFRYRISDESIVVYDRIDVSPTIGRKDGSFGFALVEYDPDLKTFAQNLQAEIERIDRTPGLFTRSFENDNLIHFSALPWIDFTSLSHARSFSIQDSCPKISFGKMTIAENGRRTFPMSVHGHHALIDGLHLGEFIDYFQQVIDLDF